MSDFFKDDSKVKKMPEVIDKSTSTIDQSIGIIPPRHSETGHEKYGSFYENAILHIRPVIEKQIKEFEAELEKFEDSSLYVGLRLTVFGQHRLILVQKIEFEEPCLIIFHGVGEDGAMLKLIQHISQLNFLLESSRRPSAEPRKPIGFAPEYPLI